MLRRFSLYGFLKNQQYHDYFLLLAFRQMGLSYFVIGVLIAFREVMVNLMEIPAGRLRMSAGAQFHGVEFYGLHRELRRVRNLGRGGD